MFEDCGLNEVRFELPSEYSGGVLIVYDPNATHGRRSERIEGRVTYKIPRSGVLVLRETSPNGALRPVITVGSEPISIERIEGPYRGNSTFYHKNRLEISVSWLVLDVVPLQGRHDATRVQPST